MPKWHNKIVDLGLVDEWTTGFLFLQRSVVFFYLYWSVAADFRNLNYIWEKIYFMSQQARQNRYNRIYKQIVLDVDSREFSAFDDIDREGLETIVELVYWWQL